MKYQPLDDNVIIEMEEIPNKVGDIYLGTTDTPAPCWGKIVAKGNKVHQVKIGDRVLYRRHAAKPLEDNLYLITIEKVLAKEG